MCEQLSQSVRIPFFALLTVCGGTLTVGLVSSHNDHRIAMLAAIAAGVCRGPITLRGAEAVKKSYPRFWTDYRKMTKEVER